MRQGAAPLALAGLPLAFLLVVLVAPAVRLVAEGWPTDGHSLQALWAPWQDDYLRWRMAWSFLQALLTCAAALVLGLPLAWVLARLEFRGRSLVLRKRGWRSISVAVACSWSKTSRSTGK